MSREAILQRLVEIADETELFRHVYRNVIEFPDSDQLPACSILEGDEAASDGDPVIRGSRAPRKAEMQPEIVIASKESPENLGADLNRLKEAIHTAVSTDTELIALTWNDRGPRYLEMNSDLAFGRQMMGRMALKYSIPYRL